MEVNHSALRAYQKGLHTLGSNCTDTDASKVSQDSPAVMSPGKGKGRHTGVEVWHSGPCGTCQLGETQVCGVRGRKLGTGSQRPSTSQPHQTHVSDG